MHRGSEGTSQHIFVCSKKKVSRQVSAPTAVVPVHIEKAWMAPKASLNDTLKGKKKSIVPSWSKLQFNRSCSCSLVTIVTTNLNNY